MRQRFRKWSVGGVLVAICVTHTMGESFAFNGEKGETVAAPAKGVRQPDRNKWFEVGYGSISAVLGIHTFGKWRLETVDTEQTLEKGSLDGGPLLGARLAGYKSVRQGRFHIGATMNFEHGFEGGWTRTLGNGNEESTTFKQFTFGVSAKGGASIHPCFWIGGGLDFGPLVYVTRAWQGETYAQTEVTSDADIGIHLFPHIALEFMLARNDSSRLALAVTAGVLFVPAIADIESSLSNRAVVQRYMTPTVSLGLMLGR